MKNLKRLIQSEIFYGFNYTPDNWVEIFKNPSSSEINNTIRNDSQKNIRGLLYKDGTIFIWPSDVPHETMQYVNKELDFNQYHFYTEGKNWIRFHMEGQHIYYEELKNSINLSENIFKNIIDLDNCNINILNLDGSNYEGTFNEFKNLKKLKVGRLIKSEIYEGFNYRDKYFEVFINPTSKEISDTKKIDSHNSIRGLINRDGNKYIWPADIAHEYINNYLKNKLLTNYFRFVYEGDIWIFHESGHGNRMTFKELQEIIKNNLDFLSQLGDLNINIHIYGIYDEHNYYIDSNYDSINEFLKEEF